jgi:hypothetical protein
LGVFWRILAAYGAFERPDPAYGRQLKERALKVPGISPDRFHLSGMRDITCKSGRSFWPVYSTGWREI